MRISLCNEVIRELPFRAQCATAAALGYSGLEVAPFTLSEDPARLSSTQRRELRAIAEGEGAPVTGLHWLMTTPAGISLTSDDPAVSARSRDHLLAMVELCADLGGSVLVHGSPDQRQLSQASSPEAGIANARALLAAAGAAAAEAGLLYCLEPLSPLMTDFINRVEEAAALIDAIGEPGLVTMLDTCAAAAAEAEPPADALDKWLGRGRIAHIHLNDRDKRAPGQGEDRFAPVIRAALKHGYAGRYAVEPFRYEPDGVAAAAVGIGYLRGLFEVLDPGYSP